MTSKNFQKYFKMLRSHENDVPKCQKLIKNVFIFSDKIALLLSFHTTIHQAKTLIYIIFVVVFS